MARRTNGNGAGLGCLLAIGLLLIFPLYLLKLAINREPLGMRAGDVWAGCAASLIGWAIIGWIVYVWPTSDIRAEQNSYVSRADQKAYEALRENGYSERDAAEAAPAIRRLCESADGRDCR